MYTLDLVEKFFLDVVKRCELSSPFRFKYSVNVKRSISSPNKIEVCVYINDIRGKYTLDVNKLIGNYLKEALNELVNKPTEGFTSIHVSVNIDPYYEPCDIPQEYLCGDNSIYGRPIPTIINTPTDIIFKEERDMYMPEVKEIIHSKSKKKGEVFTVKWTDYTETSVKLMEGDTSDEYVAFMYCMSIKMFGSKGACRQYIKDKKQVFEERVERRSEEIRQRKLKRVAEDKAKREVPYAGGLRVPALCQSSMFKKNGGGAR